MPRRYLCPHEWPRAPVADPLCYDGNQHNIRSGQRGELQQAFGAGKTSVVVPSVSRSSVALAGSAMEIASG